MFPSYCHLRVICLAALFFSVYAQAAQDPSLDAPHFVNPPIDPKSPRAVELQKDAIFLERSDQALRGVSDSQTVVFSVNKSNNNILVSLQLNGKEFLFSYSNISFKAKQLDSLHLLPDSPELNRKTKADQLALSALYRQLLPKLNQLEPLENGLLTSLDFLLNMVPVNGSFSNIDFNKARATTLVQPQAYTNTCSQRGTALSGSFDDIFGKTYTQIKTVGNPATACLGRCGVGCIQAEPQVRKRQYTQQCYAHDLCTGFFGTVLGQCSDEFTVASDDYLNAPNCSFYVVGKWRQSFDWECNGAPVAVTIAHFANHRFSTSAGLAGTWSVSGNKIIRTYDNGIKNNGTIADTNMKITGSMNNAQGRSGCFNDSYITTQAL